jgi:hypothetical protein
MAGKDLDRSLPSCPHCALPMTLVQIDPQVASFAELQTFCCFACGEVRSIEEHKSPFVQAAAWPRPTFFE